MQVKVRGQLFHYLNGDYTVGIVLSCESPLIGEMMLPILGSSWKQDLAKKALVWSGGSEALDVLKARLKSDSKVKLTIDPCGWDHCRGQCADAEIDGLQHSVDVGPAFTLSVECEDPRQESLL